MIEIDGEKFKDEGELMASAEGILKRDQITNHEGHVVSAVPSFVADETKKCKACDGSGFSHGNPLVRQCEQFRVRAGFGECGQ